MTGCSVQSANLSQQYFRFQRTVEFQGSRLPRINQSKDNVIDIFNRKKFYKSCASSFLKCNGGICPCSYQIHQLYNILLLKSCANEQVLNCSYEHGYRQPKFMYWTLSLEDFPYKFLDFQQAISKAKSEQWDFTQLFRFSGIHSWYPLHNSIYVTKICRLAPVLNLFICLLHINIYVCYISCFITTYGPP